MKQQMNVSQFCDYNSIRERSEVVLFGRGLVTIIKINKDSITINDGSVIVNPWKTMTQLED